MNWYLAVIVASLSLAWGLRTLARSLNRKALPPAPPAGFADLFDADTYRKSQDYAKARMGHEGREDAFFTALTLAVMLLGGFNVLDLWTRGLGLSPLVTGLVFIAALWLASDLLRLPLDLHETFVLEARFGFNTTTPAVFVWDKLKGWVLTLAIGGPVLWAVLWFLATAGPYAWLYCWAVTALISLALAYVAPTWILPLFNRFTPLGPGELRQALEEYAGRNGFTLTGLFVMDGSKRSTKSNAFFTGFGSKRRIALFDTLVTRHTPREILAVLAHEVGHWKMGHIRKQIVIGLVKSGLIFWLLSIFLNSPGLFAAFGLPPERMSPAAGLVFFGLLYTPLSLVLSVAFNGLLRRFEYQADAFAARTTGDPAALVQALRKLSLDNLSNLTPHPLTVALDYTHPPLVARVAALEKMSPGPTAPDAPWTPGRKSVQ